MSAQYDLYETPDPDCTGEQKPLHARIVPNGTRRKNSWNVYLVLPRLLTIT